tara:strand:- start:264 stop:494 length:231 start_codon:yes stop_codon:yes gene_type:complete
MGRLIPLLFLLVGCTQIEALAVSEGDNAFACLRGESAATAGVFGGNLSGITVEVPATVDTSGWSAQDWATLAEICD